MAILSSNEKKELQELITAVDTLLEKGLISEEAADSVELQGALLGAHNIVENIDPSSE